MMVEIKRSLEHLSKSVPESRLVGDANIREITYDSRKVGPGTLFCCVPGATVDGHVFAPIAVASGATALLVEHEVNVSAAQLIVPSVRAAMGPISDEFFGRPSSALELIGVTGTNGKTTITYFVQSVVNAAGGTPGIIGTIETRIGSVSEPVTHTTPESVDTHRLLSRMVSAGVTTCAMEVSSHGLDMGRVDGCRFGAAVFTNLTQDHLDYHETMDEYFEAKALLFDPDRAEAAVVNIDDPYGRILAKRIGRQMPLITFSLEGGADVVAADIRLSAEGSIAQVSYGGEKLELHVPISARYNVSNALAVLATGIARGWNIASTVAGIAALPGVPGRLERIDEGQDFTVLVDYAHTPDSLRNVLMAARELVGSNSKLWVVFGCGGDRDRTKRPLMGAAGAELADQCIITSDNPRSEDPALIVEQIAVGAASTGRSFEILVDRRGAIEFALTQAHAGDVVVIAGKGHETGQKFADRTIEFDDRLVAREVLEALT